MNGGWDTKAASTVTEYSRDESRPVELNDVWDTKAASRVTEYSRDESRPVKLNGVWDTKASNINQFKFSSVESTSTHQCAANADQQSHSFPLTQYCRGTDAFCIKHTTVLAALNEFSSPFVLSCSSNNCKTGYSFCSFDQQMHALVI